MVHYKWRRMAFAGCHGVGVFVMGVEILQVEQAFGGFFRRLRYVGTAALVMF